MKLGDMLPGGTAPHQTVPWKVLVILAVAFLAVTQITQQFEKR